jgi:PII-like signaling protein
MTTLQGAAQRSTVIVGESDTVAHHPLYTEIVHRAHTAERIQAFLPVLEEIVVDGLVLIEDVRVVHHAGRATG